MLVMRVNFWWFLEKLRKDYFIFVGDGHWVSFSWILIQLSNDLGLLLLLSKLFYQKKRWTNIKYAQLKLVVESRLLKTSVSPVKSYDLEEQWYMYGFRFSNFIIPQIINQECTKWEIINPVYIEIFIQTQNIEVNGS